MDYRRFEPACGQLAGQHDGGIACAAAGDQSAKWLVACQLSAKNIVFDLDKTARRAGDQPGCFIRRVAWRIGIGLILPAYCSIPSYCRINVLFWRH